MKRIISDYFRSGMLWCLPAPRETLFYESSIYWLVIKFTHMGFTAPEVWLNPRSLTYCFVLALSLLQIPDYCLPCQVDSRTEGLGIFATAIFSVENIFTNAAVYKNKYISNELIISIQRFWCVHYKASLFGKTLAAVGLSLYSVI